MMLSKILQVKSDRTTTEYLNYLSSCTWSKLKQEPSSLADQEFLLTKELNSLAYENYSTFLLANSTSSHLNVEKLAALNGELCNALPVFESFCDSFLDNSSKVLEERKGAALILTEHEKILELLEIPQLIDTFIRNGYYEEAMDLKTHVNRLQARHPNIPMLKTVAAEVEEASEVMLNQLTQLLSTNVKLPLCIRVMGYLRRMEAYSEPELQVVFLQQRFHFLQKLYSDLNRSDPFDYLRKYIEISREHFFDIVTQYRAIFSDGSHIYLSSNKETGIISNATIQSSTQTILASFTTFYVNRFINTLSEFVPLLKDTNSIHSIMTQTMYFGTSLGRIGVDFRQTVTKIFSRAVVFIAITSLQQSVESFLNFAKTSELKGISVKGALDDAFFLGFTNIQTVSPPTELLKYPSLASLLNSFFGVYNQLRIIPMLSIVEDVGSVVNGLLGRVAICMGHVGSVRVIDNEYKMACWAFACLLVPAVANGFNMVFGGDYSRLLDARQICLPISVYVNSVLVEKLEQVDNNAENQDTDTPIKS